MLAGEGAPVLEHQIGAVACDRFEPAHALFSFQINDRAYVQAAHRSMGIDAGGGIVSADHRQKPFDVIAQLFRRHGRILDEGERFGIPLHGHGETER